MPRRGRLLVLALVFVAVVPLLVFSLVVEPDELRVTVTEIPLPRWPRALSGLRVLALADIHAGAPHVDVAKLRLLVETANAQRPDLVVLLGDYVIHGVLGGRFIPPEVTAHEMAGLRARLGVFAVLGNHDHWLDGPRVRKALLDASIPVVDDDVVALEDAGRRFWLVGIRDIWSRWPDLRRLFARVPVGEPIVALTHNPDIFPSLPPGIDLLIAGHTHGGQVSLPLLGSLIVPSSYGQRFARGHIVEGGRHLFVTPGIGTSILPVRLGVPPELSLLLLRAAPLPEGQAAPPGKPGTAAPAR